MLGTGCRVVESVRCRVLEGAIYRVQSSTPQSPSLRGLSSPSHPSSCTNTTLNAFNFSPAPPNTVLRYSTAQCRAGDALPPRLVHKVRPGRVQHNGPDRGAVTSKYRSLASVFRIDSSERKARGQRQRWWNSVPPLSGLVIGIWNNANYYPLL